MKHIVQLAIKSNEFISRRETLVENILKLYNNKNHLIILPSADVQYKTHHIPRPYHQDPSFYYYTGFTHKNAILMMNVNTSSVNTTLFIDNPSEEDKLWNGHYPTTIEATNVSGIDKIIYCGEFKKFVQSSISNSENLFLWTTNSTNSYSFNDIISTLTKSMNQKDLGTLIDIQRLIKSKSEIEIMRKAATIASEALHLTFPFTRSKMNEQEILAKLYYEINIRGAKLAYPPVIAGGSRANIIHYLMSNQDIGDNELVLVDVGADVLGYYSDLTRTWPVSGKFSREQAVLYDILYTIHSDCTAAFHPGMSLNDLYEFMHRQLHKYLREHAIVTKTANTHQYCPHHIGHYLGLDIHDTPSVSTHQPLSPGTVFPLEPGLYFPSDDKFVDPRYRGIGMRLEDDFVITEAGTLDCLSINLARSRAEIEAVCNPIDINSISQIKNN